MRVRTASFIAFGAAAVIAGFLMMRGGGHSAAPASSHAGGPAAPGDAAQTAPRVTIAPAHRGDIVTSVNAVGSITSLRQVWVAPKSAGQVAQVFVQEGQRVAAGTPLMQLDTSRLAAEAASLRAGVARARAQLAELLAGGRPEEKRQAALAVAQQRAAVESAQAVLALAQSNVRRNQQLQEQGYVSQQAVDTAEAQVRTAQAALDQQQAQYASAQETQRLVNLGPRPEQIEAARAALAQAEASLLATEIQIQDATVVAPFAGVIARRAVEPGAAISPQSEAFLLAGLDQVYAVLQLPQTQRAAVRVGQDAAVAVDGLPGQTFHGPVTEVQPSADVQNRSFGVKVLLANPRGLLHPGTFARGAIVTATTRNVLVIPYAAVLNAPGSTTVFIVRDGRAFRRDVTLGASDSAGIEVKSGIDDGAEVVVRDQEGLVDGEPVIANPAAAAVP